MGKINLLVLFGGESAEHSISNISAYNILEMIDTTKYTITKIGISEDGKWYLVNASNADIKSGAWIRQVRHEAVISPSKSHKGIFLLLGDRYEKFDIDVCFPILHGTNGEDGAIQALLKLAGIKRVGAAFLPSAIAMDKKYTKIILKDAGIPVVPSLYIHKNDDWTHLDIHFPCFVKPANAGSSVGASAVMKKEELEQALKAAFAIDTCVLVEQYIDCREIECAVIGNEDVQVSVPGEISSGSAFYDFDTKYVHTDSVKLDIPADVNDSVKNTIMDYAQKAYAALGLSGMARVDFFIDRQSNDIYLNEVNTIPGFTSLSMYPLLMKHEGVSYSDLIDKLIALAE